MSLLVLAAVFGGLVWVLSPPEIPGPREAVFPLPPEYRGSFGNDWGAARVQGKHEGTDVFAPEGTPIYAVTGGTVARAWGSGGDGWNNLGGYTVMIEAGYDVGPVRRGDRLYYAHMRAPTPLEPGELVRAGQKVGEVGDTGQGPRGTRGEFEPHLHLGLYAGSPFSGDRAEARSGAINPYPLLGRVSGGPLRAEEP